jgi:hypothetical protein
MTISRIKYRKLRNYKYQLLENYSVKIEINKEVSNNFIKLSLDGVLFIKQYYAWDGPSGPTIDTKSFMRASLVHDALYQLMREGKLDRKIDRETADKVLKRICLEDGMNIIRATYSYYAVRWFGASTARAKKKYTEEHYAP